MQQQERLFCRNVVGFYIKRDMRGAPMTVIFGNLFFPPIQKKNTNFAIDKPSPVSALVCLTTLAQKKLTMMTLGFSHIQKMWWSSQKFLQLLSACQWIPASHQFQNWMLESVLSRQTSQFHSLEEACDLQKICKNGSVMMETCPSMS